MDNEDHDMDNVDLITIDIYRWPLDYLSKKLRSILSEEEEIELAYLFGSYNTGNPTKTSDLDIGIYVKSQYLSDLWYPVRVKHLIENLIEEEFQQKIDVDVRIMNNSSIKFLYEIIHNTQKLIVRDENFRVHYESRILIEWYDIRETWNQFFDKRLELLTQK